MSGVRGEVTLLSTESRGDPGVFSPSRLQHTNFEGTRSGHRRDFVLPVPTTLGSAGLEILDPKGNALLPGYPTRVPLKYKIRL